MAGSKAIGKYRTRLEWELKVRDMHDRGVRTSEISVVTESTRSSIDSFLKEKRNY